MKADDKSKLSKAVEAIRAAAADVGGVQGREVDLLANELEAMTLSPPTLKTSDFENQGAEVPFPAIDPTDAAALERVIDESDFLPVWFLEVGARLQRAVGRVFLTKATHGLPPGAGWGTGFLASPSLFVTNNHVIPTVAFCSRVKMQFNYQLSPVGEDQPADPYEPAPEDFFHTSKKFDYTVIRLRAKAGVGPDGQATSVLPGSRWGHIPLNPDPVYRKKQHLNIVQHPDGRRKEVALQDNEIESLFVNVVHYKSDTEPGSSGSPVCDNLWQLVALHHAGGDQDPATGKFLNNEGIRVDQIVSDLRAALPADSPVRAELGI